MKRFTRTFSIAGMLTITAAGQLRSPSTTTEPSGHFNEAHAYPPKRVGGNPQKPANIPPGYPL